MERIFVTHIAPKDRTIELKMSLSATNFSYNLIAGDLFDKVFSILPTYVNGKNEFKKSSNIEFIYSPFRWKNRVFRKIAPIVENITLFRKIPNNSSVWFYNVSVLNITVMLLLMLFKHKVKVNLIVLDYTPGEFLNRLFLPIINRCDGRICLSTSELFNKRNSVCLPGVVPENNISYNKIKSVNRNFLISGAIRENIALISMLLESFSKLPNCTLHITGRLFVKDELIRAYTEQYSNIVFHSTLNNEEYNELLDDCSLVLSTRDPNYPENQCNFPSKIIEALLHNRIVLSTIEYPQLGDIRYFKVSPIADEFIRDVEEILSMSDDLLLDYANQSDCVKAKFNTSIWEQTMEIIENKTLL